MTEIETLIRPMTLDDLVEVYAIEISAQVVPWSEGIFRDCINAGYEAWVAIENGAIQGYILVFVRSGECHILNICIKPTSQRRGVAQQLLRHALGYANLLEADTAVLEVRPSNHVAVYIYRKLGFNEIGLRKDYYATPDGGREDALVFALDLAAIRNMD